MKQAVLTGIRELEIVETPQPRIRDPHEVLLKIEVVGVCGSDIHYYTTGRIGSQVVSWPYAVGHECAATVAEVGSAVTTLQPGDKVAVDPAVSCGNCDQCRVGREHTCRNLKFLGCPGQLEGCLATYYVMPEPCCYKVRPDTSLEEAALVEPLSIGVYAVQQSVPMTPRTTVGILGAGPIGLCCLVAAKAAGAESFYVTEPIPARQEKARQAGARYAADPYSEDVVAAITDEEPMLLDVVFECVGKQDTIDDALRLLKPGGKLMLIGIPETDRLSFTMDLMRRREICVQNVRRQNQCVRSAIDLIESRAVDVSFMLTHHYTLDRCKEAFDLVDAYADGVVKAMVTA